MTSLLMVFDYKGILVVGEGCPHINQAYHKCISVFLSGSQAGSTQLRTHISHASLASWHKSSVCTPHPITLLDLSYIKGNCACCGCSYRHGGQSQPRLLSGYSFSQPSYQLRVLVNVLAPVLAESSSNISHICSTCMTWKTSFL